jgi:hypothetical protein
MTHFGKDQASMHKAASGRCASFRLDGGGLVAGSYGLNPSDGVGPGGRAPLA